MPKNEPPQDLPSRLLGDRDMIEACSRRDFSQVFRLVKARAGIYPSLIARRCDMTPSRVAEVIAGQRMIKDINVIERVADGLRIPGRLLGLARREWEPSDGQHPVVPFSATVPTWMTAATADDDPIGSPDDDLSDPGFVLSLIESQLPELYKGANFFGARQSVPSALHHAQSIMRLLDSTNGPIRDALLRTGALVAEFLGWLYQDLGDFRAAAHWSDRSMEWAQEAADDHLQSYVLYRKSHQAASRGHGQKAVALSRAAQRIPGLTSQITALAAQQEAQGYVFMQNPRAALAKFDEAHELASVPPEGQRDSKLDTSYCTPTYVEIQRANCWIDLGDPMRAVGLLEVELAALPRVYRNDRGVYLARLARAYARGDEPEMAADTAAKALAIVNQTGSARTLTELDSVATLVGPQQNMAAVTTFTEQFTLVRERLTT
jgi:hypothetical protein